MTNVLIRQNGQQGVCWEKYIRPRHRTGTRKTRNKPTTITCIRLFLSRLAWPMPGSGIFFLFSLSYLNASHFLSSFYFSVSTTLPHRHFSALDVPRSAFTLITPVPPPSLIHTLKSIFTFSYIASISLSFQHFCLHLDPPKTHIILQLTRSGQHDHRSTICQHDLRHFTARILGPSNCSRYVFSCTMLQMILSVFQMLLCIIDFVEPLPPRSINLLFPSLPLNCFSLF